MPPQGDAFPERDPGLPRFAVVAAVAALGLALVTALRPPIPPSAALTDDRAQGLLGAGPAAPDPVAVGREVFLAQGCGGCHAMDVASGGGPALVGLWQRAELRLSAPDYQGGARDPETYLREAVLDHCLDPLPGYNCPDLDDLAIRLSVGDVDALLAYLRSAGGADAAAGPTVEGRP